MIRAKNVFIGYSDTRPILRDINLEIYKNSVLIGPNGSGKTTFINAILGIARVIKGELTVFNKEVSKIRNFIGISSNNIDFYKIILGKVRDVIRIYASLNKVSDETIISFLKFFNFTSFNNKINELSLGQQKILGNALALSLNSKLALLDEPFENLDPLRRLKMVKVLNEKRDGIVLLTTHEMDLVKRLKGWDLYLVYNGSIYGPFNAEKVNNLYVNKGKVDKALAIINTNTYSISITEGNGEFPLSSIGDIENLEVIINDYGND